MSDLHLEFGPLDTSLPGGDVLVLAGDIFLAADLCSEQGRSAETRDYYQAFLTQAALAYERVYYLTGNHEYYHSELNAAHDVLARDLPPSIVWLDDRADTYRGVTFVGGTLWTNFNNRDPHAMAVAKEQMNDFHKIVFGSGRFTPDIAAMRFDATLGVIEAAAKGNDHVVVVTHHCPSVKCSSHGKIAPGDPLNHAYYSDLEPFIREHPSISNWICGHTHERGEWQVEQCCIRMNCRGYIGHEDMTDDFDPTVSFELAEG